MRLTTLTRAIAATLAAAAGSAAAVDDRPPELGAPQAPDTLTPLHAPQPEPRGAVQVRFAGLKSFTEESVREAIKRQIATMEELGLTEASAYDTAFFLESFYRRNGYPFAKVAGVITGSHLLRLDVVEGPFTKVGEVRMRGNRHFDTATLTNYLLGSTRERFPRMRSDTELPFSETDVHTGIDLIRRLYAAEGFLDAIVDQAGISYTADLHSARIQVRVKEGIQYWFGPVTLTGASVHPREQLIAQIDEELSQPFTEGRLAAAQRKLVDFYKNRGHFTAEVRAESSRQAARRGRVPVTFHLAPDAIYYFNGITVKGADRVAPDFLEKRFSHLQGRVYDPALVDKQFREMIETGLFQDLRINPVPGPGNQLRLELEVEEAKAKELSLGLGAGSFEGGFVSLGYGDRNLFGSGRPLRLTAEWSSRGYKGELTYSDPWLLESQYNLGLRAYAQTRDLDDYEKIEYGAHPTLSRKINDHWEVSLFALAKHVSIESSKIEPAELVGPPDYWAHSIGVSQKIDFRNNKVNPSRGFLALTTFDAGLLEIGSDVEFLRGTFQFSYYLPVTARSVLALGARGGLISPGGTRSLPIEERFFSGGSTTVRSFAERELGPKDDRDHPIGGEAYTTFNAEYTFPLRGDLKGAVFFDAGSLQSRARDFGLDDLRYAVGVGLRYTLAIGAVRLDLGLNPRPHEGEARGAFHFSFGGAF